MGEFQYVGSELELFADVHNWKDYWSSRIRRYITGDVLEVGAGIGSNTQFLAAGVRGRWVCLEPDARLVAQLTANVKQTGNGAVREVVTGTLGSLGAGQKFDTIIYIDVLEHIEDDRQEMELAASHLRPGGRVVVLSPAHQKLFTPFDAAIGHYRRYDRPMLRRVSPPGLRLEKMFYLDSVGLLLSMTNRVLLQQSMPTKSQLQFWDRGVIPISRIVDKLTFGQVGKTIIGIWQG